MTINWCYVFEAGYNMNKNIGKGKEMAVICFICEGAYPYIVGGVSSWVHELISSNPQHFFKVLCIIPNKEFAKLKYELPKNVIEVKNIYLDTNPEFSLYNIIRNNQIFSREKRKSTEKLLDFSAENIENKLQEVEGLFERKFGKPLEVILSHEYWNTLLKYYNRNHSDGNFSTFYWTYRNITMNLLNIAQSKVPKANIYHSVATGYSGFLGAIIAHQKKGKVILTEHGIYPREREEEILGATWVDSDFKQIWIDYFYYLSKLAYRHSDKIIALFEYNRQIQIEYGAPIEKTAVIPNGVDEKKYGRIVREKREGFNIGSVLRVVPIKDIKMMIKGFKIASEKIPEAKLWLIGPTDEDEEYYEECIKLVDNLGLKEKVVFTGRADVTEYYSFLDLLLLTSISEGQPLSILEGLASGVPFISTDVGNCREILLEKKDIGEAGVIIPPTSYTDLALALVQLYHSPDKLAEFSRNGKKIVEKYYSKSAFIQKYQEIYDEMGGL